jgi:chromate reductase
VTPEYNRSIPGVLKNAIDVGSRPYGASVWNGKPGAVISASPGAIGGFGAYHHLRQTLVFLNVPALNIEAYIGGAFALFDENGELVNESTTEFLRGYGEAFKAWIEKILADETAAAKAA